MRQALLATGFGAPMPWRIGNMDLRIGPNSHALFRSCPGTPRFSVAGPSAYVDGLVRAASKMVGLGRRVCRQVCDCGVLQVRSWKHRDDLFGSPAP